MPTIDLEARRKTIAYFDAMCPSAGCKKGEGEKEEVVAVVEEEVKDVMEKKKKAKGAVTEYTAEYTGVAEEVKVAKKERKETPGKGRKKETVKQVWQRICGENPQYAELEKGMTARERRELLGKLYEKETGEEAPVEFLKGGRAMGELWVG